MTDRFADKYSIKSNKFYNYNYSSPGNYFITICTLNHHNFFGKIIDNKMVYSKCGQITSDCLMNIPKHFPVVCLTDSIIMPNHVHILFHVETHDRASLQDNRKITLINYSHKNHPNYFPRLTKKSNQIIPNVVNQFKSSVKRICNQQNIFFAWQSRYYDVIVKDDNQLFTIKNYIISNPTNWQKDKYNLPL